MAWRWPHFSQREFDCKGMGSPGHPVHSCPIDSRLLDGLERLRAMKGGRPLAIVSGYRCPIRNRQVGGATKSQHLGGWAADIPEGYCTPAEARAAGFTGIGIAGPWAVHVDIRQRVTYWRYR